MQAQSTDYVLLNPRHTRGCPPVNAYQGYRAGIFYSVRGIFSATSVKKVGYVTSSHEDMTS